MPPNNWVEKVVSILGTLQKRDIKFGKSRWRMSAKVDGKCYYGPWRGTLTQASDDLAEARRSTTRADYVEVVQKLHTRCDGTCPVHVSTRWCRGILGVDPVKSPPFNAAFGTASSDQQTATAEFSIVHKQQDAECVSELVSRSVGVSVRLRGKGSHDGQAPVAEVDGRVMVDGFGRKDDRTRKRFRKDDRIRTGRKQIRTGRQQSRTGREQSRIGREQSRTGRVQSRTGRKQSRTDRKQCRSGREQSRIGRKDNRIGRKQNRIGRKQSRIGCKQIRIGRKQNPTTLPAGLHRCSKHCVWCKEEEQQDQCRRECNMKKIRSSQGYVWCRSCEALRQTCLH